MEPPGDDEDVPAARRGDLTAFGRLVVRHQSAVRAMLICRLATPHEAEDLAQEAFVTAFRRLDKFQAGQAFGPWVRGIAFNLLRNHQRKFRPLPVGGAEELQSLLQDRLEEELGATSEVGLMEALAVCLHKLEERDQALLHRRYHDETPVEQLARDHRRTTSAITMRLHRLRQALGGCIRTQVGAAP